LNILDVIIAAFIIMGFILGFKDGFVRKIIGLAGFILATYLSIKLAASFGRTIESVFKIEFYFAEIIAGIIIFLLIILITSIVKRVVHPFDKVNNTINQLIGGVVGIFQMLFFLSAVFLILNVFNQPGEKLTSKSYFHGKVLNIIPSVINYVKNYTPETKKIIKDYINDKDKDTTR
jgi:membrane protein required for colicin V production